MTKTELKRNLSDREWRINNLYYIVDQDGNLVQFNLKEQQKELLDDMHNRNIILKARQIGFSTLIVVMMLDVCLFNSDTACGIIAHSLDDAQKLLAKAKKAYDNLPKAIRNSKPLEKCNTTTLELANGSSLEVGTSMRSGTKLWLHISEFGKICAKFPEKAREVITGSLPAVSEEGVVFIESTAEGQEGRFYEMTQEARNLHLSGKELAKPEYKFFFFPWWDEPRYTTDGDIIITADHNEYFARMKDKVREELNIELELTEGQKRWWVAQKKTLHDDMGREHPSFPSEAFEQAIEGAYFAKEMANIREQNRLRTVNVEPALPVNTFWDLGMNDQMTIWMHQYHRGEHRFLKYYANSGESLQHYANYLNEWARDNNIVFRRHYVPHDANVREMTSGQTRYDRLNELLTGEVELVKRVKAKGDAIQKAREMLPLCYFDEKNTSEGVKCLDNYRKEWNENLGVFRNSPRHDWASHGADGFMTFATGWETEDTSTDERLDYGDTGYF